MDKAKEKLSFELFCNAHFGYVPGFVQLEPPHPDISFEFQGSLVGLEICEIQSDSIPGEHGGSEIARGESTINEVSKRIQNYFEQICPKGHILTVGFNAPPSYVNRTEVFEGIKNLVDRLVAQPDEPIPEHELCNYELIHGISITPSEKDHESVYIYTMAQWAPRIGDDHISKYVGHKSERRQGYEACYSEFWLLLVFNASLSSDFDLDASVGSLSEENVWDKVFLFNAMTGYLNSW